MDISVCKDADGRINGLCPDDLTGGEGWEYVDDGRLSERTGVSLEEMFNHLFNDGEAARFKWVDGYAELRDEAEIAGDMEIAAPPLDPMDVLRAEIEALKLALFAVIDRGQGQIAEG